MSWPIEETYKNLEESFSQLNEDGVIDVMLDAYQRLDEALKPVEERSDFLLYMLLTEALQLGCAHGRHINPQEKRVADFVAALFTGTNSRDVVKRTESECRDLNSLFIVKLAKPLPAICKPFLVFLYSCIYIDGAITQADRDYLSALAPHLSASWAQNS